MKKITILYSSKSNMKINTNIVYHNNRNMKYLGVILTKGMKDLYTEN